MNRPLLCSSTWACHRCPQHLPARSCAAPAGAGWSGAPRNRPAGAPSRAGCEGSETPSSSWSQPDVFFQSTQWIPGTVVNGAHSGGLGLSVHPPPCPMTGRVDARLGWCSSSPAFHTTPHLAGGRPGKDVREMTLSPSVLFPDPLHAPPPASFSLQTEHRHLPPPKQSPNGADMPLGMHFICFLTVTTVSEVQCPAPHHHYPLTPTFPRNSKSDCISPSKYVFTLLVNQ